MFHNGLTILIAWIAIPYLAASGSDTGCDKGSFRLGTKCYDPYFERAATFSNAKEICEYSGNTIAIFENEQISDFLINIGIKFKYQSYWIDSVYGGCSSISFENNYEVELEECNNNMFYACEIESGTDTAQNCSWHENKCYKLIYVRVPSRETNTRCSRLKGRLASVKTPGEREFFKKLLQEDKWWKNIHEEEIKRNHFSDFITFWSGKSSYGKCGIRSYNSFKEHGDCESYNNFFCEYNAAPDTVPNTSTNPTTQFTTTRSTTIVTTTSTLPPTTSTLATSSLQPTTSTLDSTDTLPSTATTTSLEVTTSTLLPTTTSLETSTDLINTESITDTVTQKSDDITEQESKPEKDEKEDSAALKPIEIAIIGIMGGLFIIITIVIVQLFKLRKRLFSKYYSDHKEKPGPQTLPLLPPSPTSIAMPLSPTTDDDYLTPYTSINSLPSDDTREGNPIPISTRGVPINGSRFGIEANSLYGNSSEGSQGISRSSQEPIYHHYEEIQYNGVVIS